MFNVTLLFTKPLMRFKVVHHFKPLLDAFQGPFKYQYYYWTGIQMLIRNVMVLFYILRFNVSITLKLHYNCNCGYHSRIYSALQQQENKYSGIVTAVQLCHNVYVTHV